MDKKIKQRGPDFIGIGVPKSGSTWFMRVLSQHPDIFTTSKKEPHFFISEKLYAQGIGNYCDLYKNAQPSQVAGEFSTKYINFAKISSSRIKYNFPETKLICILRDPLERAISHYKWLKQLGRINKNMTLKDAIKDRKGIIDFSKYAEGVRIFCNDFSKEKILFIRTEDLKSIEKDVFASVNIFLDINKFDYETKDIAKSETIEPKFRIFENLRTNIHKIIRSNNQDWILNTNLALSFSKFYRKLNNEKIINTEISKADKKLLQSYFKDDLAELKKLIDIDMKNWNTI